ncbi:hypothetical protein ABPG74_004539 [Tetrahymena malaccensis]
MGKTLQYFSYGLSLVIFCTFVYVYLSSPVYNGYVTHTHLKYGVVYIRRDEYGIPTIKGNKLRDTMFGLGYSQCQDRQWNMDFSRRFAQGRLSEIFGNKTLEMDIQQREFGLMSIVKNMNIDEQTREHLQAFTDGVNECNINKKARSLEYLITRSEFQEWTIEDSISILMQVQLFLAQDFPAELIREKIASKYSRDISLSSGIHWEQGHIPLETIMTEEDVKKMGLFENYNASSIDQQQAPKVAEDYIDKILKSGLSEFLDHQRGSNTWAIHGNHTNTGKPIVANDPHLFNGMPSFWYQVQLIYQNERNITISGQSTPGIPGIFSGITDYLAWGVTALSNDIADLYSEKLNDQNTQYFFDGKWRDLKFRNEVIKINGYPAYKLTVKETHHGPILSSQYKDSNLALCWVNRIHSLNSLTSLYKLYEATNLKQALEQLQNLEVNFGLSFATNDNHIGFYATGIIPLRNNPEKSAFIQDGTNRNNDWIGFLPKSQNPHLIDPERGFIVAANNKISPNSAKGFASVNMHPTPRAQRIREMIEQYIKEGKKISVEDVKKMQQDSVDVYARQVVPHVINLYEKQKQQQKYFPIKIRFFYNYFKFKNRFQSVNETQKIDQMISHLKNWTFSYEKQLVGGTIFSTFNLKVGEKLFNKYSSDKKQKNEAIFYYHMETFIMNQIIQWSSGQDQNSPWCDDSCCSEHQQKCVKLFFQAIKDTYDYLQKRLGQNIAEWQWQRVHEKQIPHITFKSIPYLSSILNRSYPASGNKRTVGVNGENFKGSDLNSIFSANMRAVYSLDRKDKSFYILDTGISESILSSNYDDQLKLYQQGEYIEIKRDLNRLKENNKDMLLLVYDPKLGKKSQEQKANDTSKQETKTKTQQQQTQQQNKKQQDEIKTDM